eukprot:TRINITY_DN9773_c0_g1_i5.p1 TRINITY_DN9773_c0_g1~~TRINITY_DN9773_c0_g1_i5.p1  ORF type:complete len:216 (-),score=59.51 TRINITY_DN9773_c0_g1_i5:140-787(-)
MGANGCLATCAVGEAELALNELELEVKGEISRGYRSEGVLSEDDLKLISKHLICSRYMKRIGEQRKLQARRAKALSKKLGDDYVKLVSETRQLEDAIELEAQKETLSKLKVFPEDYEAAKPSLHAEAILQPSLREASKLIRSATALSPDKAERLNDRYQKTYEAANFVLNTSPDKARELSLLLSEGVDYVDVVVADMLYSEFRLLPLEVLSLVSH